jgi:hypothetical protein
MPAIATVASLWHWRMPGGVSEPVAPQATRQRARDLPFGDPPPPRLGSPGLQANAPRRPTKRRRATQKHKPAHGVSVPVPDAGVAFRLRKLDPPGPFIDSVHCSLVGTILAPPPAQYRLATPSVQAASAGGLLSTSAPQNP